MAPQCQLSIRGSDSAAIRVQICVLGDAHLDVVVRVTEPLAEDADTPATTHIGVGGQASRGDAHRVAQAASRQTPPADTLSGKVTAIPNAVGEVKTGGHAGGCLDPDDAPAGRQERGVQVTVSAPKGWE
jgi:hypothetical protein